ncbi:MAG: helix-turn-helix domain-containing protein [Verrucomicrobiota bacterium]
MRVRAEDAGAVLALGQCQRLLKQRLAKLRLDLFPDLTGLRLYAWWHELVADSQPGGFPKANSPLSSGGLPAPRNTQHATRNTPHVFCPRARQRPSAKPPERCNACLRKRWPQGWSGQRAEKRFGGLCGASNFCAGVKVLDGHPVTLTVQQTPPASRARQRAFIRAVRLARLIVHDLEATLRAGQASPLSCQSKEPGAGETPALPLSHCQQIVQRMLDYIHEHYSRPMQLGDVAAALNMNAAYLSDLFSSTTGVRFHHCLEQLRLARAKELLRDPLKHVGEVAFAVGVEPTGQFLHQVRRVTTTAGLFRLCEQFLDHDRPMPLEPFSLPLNDTDVMAGEQH